MTAFSMHCASVHCFFRSCLDSNSRPCAVTEMPSFHVSLQCLHHEALPSQARRTRTLADTLLTLTLLCVLSCSPPWGHLTLKQQAPSPQPAAEPEAAQKPASSQRAVGGAAAAAVAPPPPGQKRCSRCRVAKPRGDFHRNRTTADGLQYQCKSCHAEVRLVDFRIESF